MFNTSYVSLCSGDMFWQNTAIAAGTVICCYGIYKLINRNSQIDDITNKCVFITGCDSGFGHALALQLDKQKIPVFAGCLTKEGAESLGREASSLLKTVLVDVCSTDSIRNAFKFVNQHMPLGAIFWGVVNNAGIAGPGGPTEFLKRVEYEKLLQVNFLGQVDVINTFLPLLKQSKGRIVNIASIAAKIPIATNPGYCASKFAVLGYTESLRLEKKPWGINVSTIMPGLFITGMTDINNITQRRKEQWDNLPEEIKQEYGQEYYDKKIKLSSNFVKGRSSKSDLSPVTNAIQKALFSRKPQAVYLVGADAKMLAFIEKLPFGLSQYVSDKVNSMPMNVLPQALKNKTE